MAKANETVTVTLKKSVIGCNPKQRACVKGLGLRKLGHTVVVNKTPAITGMINKVNFLLSVEGAE